MLSFTNHSGPVSSVSLRTVSAFSPLNLGTVNTAIFSVLSGSYKNTFTLDTHHKTLIPTMRIVTWIIIGRFLSGSDGGHELYLGWKAQQILDLMPGSR